MSSAQMLGVFSKLSESVELKAHHAYLLNSTISISTPLSIHDSSQLSTSDLVKLAEHLLQLTASTDCLVIAGTDTFSYLSSYLALSVNHPNLCLLASMDTLCCPDDPSTINLSSYAFKALSVAIGQLKQGGGLSAVVDGQILNPLTLSKLHSHRALAFRDSLTEVSSSCEAPNNAHFVPSIGSNPSLSLWRNHGTSPNPITDSSIAVIWCNPSHTRLLEQLRELLTNPPEALLLVGYGSGNWAHTPQLCISIQALSQQCVIALSTQVNFGGCNTDYAAGFWLHDYSLSSATLSFCATYSALLSVCVNYPDRQARIKALSSLFASLDQHLQPTTQAM